MAGKEALKKDETPLPVGQTTLAPANGSKAPTTDEVEQTSVFDKAKKARASTFDLSKYNVKGELTTQLFSIGHSKELVIKCTSEMYDKKLPNAGRGKSEETDTKLVDMIDLKTGESGALICNTLIVGAFLKAGGPITGRVFAIRENGIRDGKKYRSIDVIELSE